MTSAEFDKLIDRYLAGKASPADERLIDDFFRSQRRKQPVRSDDLSDPMWSAIQHHLRHTTKPPVQRARPSMARRNIVVACLVAVVLSLGGWLINTNDFFAEAKQEMIVTSAALPGQKILITLPDESRVYLNSGSSISYPEFFSTRKREITLSGEAFFAVSPDENRPFVVHTGDVTTTVLGTSFNIHAFEKDNVSVTVATGKVQVDAVSDEAGKDARVLLTPNQQTVYNVSTGFTTSVVDVEKFVAWKSNTIHFDDTSLEEAVEVLERWYNVTIQFENNEIRKCRINGTYRDQTLAGVMKSIQYMYQIEAKRLEQNKLILYGKGCSN